MKEPSDDIIGPSNIIVTEGYKPIGSYRCVLDTQSNIPMQPIRRSLLESVVNVSVGLAISIVFPVFGITLSYTQSTGIALTFTAISLARTFAIRRIFTHLDK